MAALVPFSIVAGSASELAGRYPSALGELRLSGEELYLFHDGTYLYCEWADIFPLTVYDKGRWSVSRGVVRLQSDLAFAWKPNLERQYMAVQRLGIEEDKRLLGLDRGVSYFLQNAEDHPDWMFLVVTLLRDKVWAPSQDRRIKHDLMKQAWRPEEFKAGG